MSLYQTNETHEDVREACELLAESDLRSSEWAERLLEIL
jgi:hypothetical protein